MAKGKVSQGQWLCVVGEKVSKIQHMTPSCLVDFVHRLLWWGLGPFIEEKIHMIERDTHQGDDLLSHKNGESVARAQRIHP